jgi:hypothetical protein
MRMLMLGFIVLAAIAWYIGKSIEDESQSAKHHQQTHGKTYHQIPKPAATSSQVYPFPHIQGQNISFEG